MENAITIPDAVRLRPVFYFNQYVKNGDLANILCEWVFRQIHSFRQEELEMVITITHSNLLQIEFNHSLLEALPLDLQRELDHKSYSLLVLVGLFSDAKVSNKTGTIIFKEGKVTSMTMQPQNVYGTSIIGQLDETIIPNPLFKPDALIDKLKTLSCFFPNHKYTLKHFIKDELQYFNIFQSEEGLLELFKYKLGYRLPYYFSHHGKQWLRCENPYDAAQVIEVKDDELENVRLRIIVAPFNNTYTHVISYYDYELTPNGGSHVDLLIKHLKGIKIKRACKSKKGYTCLVAFEGDYRHFSYPDTMKDRVDGLGVDALMLQAIEQLDLW